MRRFVDIKSDGSNQSGNPAAVSSEFHGALKKMYIFLNSLDLGQWFCVPIFRVVCLYLTFCVVSDRFDENLNKKTFNVSERMGEDVR